MATREDWGYAFDSDHSLAAMVAILNSGGPWTWQLRESSWYGDYLQTRPEEGCRVRIHDPRQSIGKAPEGGWEGPYCLTAEVGPEARLTRDEIDLAVRELLERLAARNVAECEPFD